MQSSWIIWGFVGLIFIFSGTVAIEDFPIGFYTYNPDDKTQLNLHIDLSSIDDPNPVVILSVDLTVELSTDVKPPGSAIHALPIDISSITREKQNVLFTFPSSLENYETEIDIVLKIVTEGEDVDDLFSTAHFTLGSALPPVPTLKYYSIGETPIYSVLSINDKTITSTFDEKNFIESNIEAVLNDNKNYILTEKFNVGDSLYLCIKDITSEKEGERGKALPHCYLQSTNIETDEPCKDEIMESITVNEKDVVVTGIPIDAGANNPSVMVLKDFTNPICASWDFTCKGPTETLEGKTTIDYLFIDKVGVCAKGKLNVMQMTTEKIDNFVEVEWTLPAFIEPQDEHKYTVEFLGEPGVHDDASRTYKVDCTGDDIVHCDVYYFPDDAEHVLSNLKKVTLANDQTPTKKTIDDVAFTTERKSGTKTMDIVSSNFSNKKNSEVCVFDKLMPTTNSSEFSYELVVANSEGAWKKYSAYTKMEQSICFAIQLPTDKYMPNSQIHLAAIKRDVKKRSISSSSYVKTFLAEPKVKLLNADVAKVELEGVGHKFLIRDAATNKIITRDVQKKGLEAYIRVEQKNGGVSNKEFIMEMRDGRMVSRIQFKTPEYKAVSE